MATIRSTRFSPLGVLLLGLLGACGGGSSTPPDGNGGEDGGGGRDDAGGGKLDGSSDEDAGGGNEDGSVDLDARTPCGLTSCRVGQRCDETGDGMCIDVACTELTCGGTEECSPAPGGGNYCKSIACSSDVQCSESRHCDGTKCVDDACEANAQRCSGNQVFQCSDNGGTDQARFSCTGSAYFTSTCGEATSGSVGCTCQDDWDCPSFTACNAGTCQGTGVAPTCTLPAARIQDVLPELEFRWGGASNGSPAAAD